MRSLSRLFAFCFVLFVAGPALADVTADCASQDSEVAFKACTQIINNSSTGKQALAEAYRNRAIAQRYDDEKRTAMMVDFEKAIQIDPKNASLYVSRAESYPDNETPSAIEDFTKAIELEPKKAAHYLRRAELNARIDQLSDAEDDYAMAIKLEPDKLNGYALRSVFYVQHEKYTEALADTDKMVSLKKDAETYFARGNVRTLLGNTDQAIADLGECIKFTEIEKAKKQGESSISPDLFCFGMRGLNHLHKKAHDLAISDLSKAIAIYDHVVLHQLRGSAFVGRQQYELAIEDFSKAIDMAPGEVQGYYMRANAYELSGQMRKAVADRTEAAFLTAGLKKPRKK